MNTLFNRLSIYAGVFGAGLAALNALALCLEAMQKPEYRWVVWGLATGFLVFAAIQSKGELSPIKTTDGQPARQSNPQRQLAACFASIILVVLIGDVLIIMLRSPVEWTPITDAHGLNLENPADAPYPIEAADQAIENGVLADSTGIRAFSLLTRRPGIEHLLIRDLTVEVVRFEPLLEVKSVYGGLVELDHIEATFVVERKETELPWAFSPVGLIVNGEEIKRLPVRVTDSAPFELAYCIKARDRGIYWIHCIAWVSDGISPAKRLQLTPNPIRLGFYNFDPDQQPMPIDDLPLSVEPLPP